MLHLVSVEAPDQPQPMPASPPVPQPAPPPRPSLVEIARRAPVASLIIAINVIVFVLAERAGGTTRNDTLIRFGAVWRGRVWEGEYWRLATSMFLHIGFVHLLWNGYYGFRISAQVEQAIGGWRFLALYLLSGIAGSAVSVIGHDAISAGASGALFGLIGWQIAVARARMGGFRAMWEDPGTRRDLTWIGAWFVVGIFAGFDNYAHGGGLAFGLLFTWALMAPPPRRRARLAVALASFAALVALSLGPLPVIHAQERALRKAYHSQGDSAAVLALTEPLLVSKKRIEVQRLRGEALFKLGRYQEAMDAAGEVIAHYPSDAAAYLTRGGARLVLGDAAGGEADFQHALELDGSDWTRNAIAWYRSAQPR
jgi:rhomboid protease GluP